MEVILLGIAKGKNICNIAKEGGETITPDREKEFAEHRSVSQELRGKRILFSSATQSMSERNKREYKCFIARVFSETKRYC